MKMARLPSAFNAKDNEKMGDFTPIDPGVYVAQIVKSEMKDVKSNAQHKYLQLDFEVLQGDAKGRKLYVRLNLVNSNQQTVDIAFKELASICEACGIPIMEDSEQVHNVPMEVNVVFIPQKAQYSAKNEIKSYAPIGGSSPSVGAGGTSTASTPAEGGKQPPWMKKSSS